MASTNAELLVKIKDAIEAILDGGAVQSYTINGRNLQRYSLTELMELQAKIERDIALEGAPRSTVVRFNQPE